MINAPHHQDEPAMEVATVILVSPYAKELERLGGAPLSDGVEHERT